jgi:hypothetical protein
VIRNVSGIKRHCETAALDVFKEIFLGPTGHTFKDLKEVRCSLN